MAQFEIAEKRVRPIGRDIRDEDAGSGDGDGNRGVLPSVNPELGNEVGGREVDVEADSVGRGHALDRSFVALPPQDMKIGSLEFSKVPFFTLASGDRNSSSLGFDGLLTMGLFRRVFICHSDHFAVLEPR